MTEARISDPYLDGMLSRGESVTHYWRAWLQVDDAHPVGRITLWEYMPEDTAAAGW